MNRDEETYDNRFVAGHIDFFDKVLQDDSASGAMSKNLPAFMGDDSPPLEQFNENHQPNNKASSLESSIPGIPSPNEGSQFAHLRIIDDNTFHGNVDSGNGNSLNNLSERDNIHLNQPNNNLLAGHTRRLVRMPSGYVRLQNLQLPLLGGDNFPTNIGLGNAAVLNNLPEGYNFPRNRSSNNFELLNKSPMIKGTALYAAHQNNNSQPLAGTLHSNIDAGRWHHGGNRCRGIQESVSGVGTSSPTCPPSLIATVSNRSPQNNSKVNPISINHTRIEQLIPNGSTAQVANKEDLPLQGLRKLPDVVKALYENDANVEDIFDAMEECTNSVANEFGNELREQADLEREKEEIRNIHAKDSNKKEPARELFLREIVNCLWHYRKTLVQETKRLKQEIQAQDKTIEELASRSNPTGLSEQPHPDDSNWGNSGGGSGGRGPEPGEPSSRDTQAVGFNRMTFSNLQPSKDGSASDDLSATTASRMSAENLLTSSTDGNCVSNSRYNAQSSFKKVYQDFVSEEHSDDDECDDSAESSDEGLDNSTEMFYGTGDHWSDRDNNERKACSRRSDNRHTSHTAKKDNRLDDCTEEVASGLLESMKTNEGDSIDGSNHSSQMHNRECDDYTMKKDNARVGCIEMIDIGQGESKNNENKPHLSSTPSSSS